MCGHVKTKTLKAGRARAALVSTLLGVACWVTAGCTEDSNAPGSVEQQAEVGPLDAWRAASFDDLLATPGLGTGDRAIGFRFSVAHLRASLGDDDPRFAFWFGLDEAGQFTLAVGPRERPHFGAAHDNVAAFGSESATASLDAARASLPQALGYHLIDGAQADALVDAWQSITDADAVARAFFHDGVLLERLGVEDEVVQRVIATPGTTQLVAYLGRTPAGRVTLALAAADSDGAVQTPYPASSPPSAGLSFSAVTPVVADQVSCCWPDPPSCCAPPPPDDDDDNQIE